MAHEVLPVLLGDVHDVVAVPRHAGVAGEVLRVREQAAPLRLEQIDDVQVLALRLGMGALRREEVDVGVSAVPALGLHVGPALQPQRQLPLAGLYRDLGPQRLVLEAAGNVDYHLAARKPALAGAVDVGVGYLPQAGVAPYVDVPGAQVGVDLIVVAVRLVRHAVPAT